MTSEVVKKRGRPKKVICDPVATEIAETAPKSTVRSKSTNASPKAQSVKTKATTAPPKASISSGPKAKPVANSSPTSKNSTKPPLHTPKTAFSTSTTEPSNQKASTPLQNSAKTTAGFAATPGSSEILSQVRELSAKNIPLADEPLKTPKLSPASVSPKTPSTPPAPLKKALPPASAKFSPANQSRAQPQPSVVQPKPNVPIAALKSQIVSNMSSGAGARSNMAGTTNRPTKNYKPMAKKVTMTIVAMPIAIVTSWVLYNRLVLGEDQKMLVKPGLTMVKTTGGKDARAEPASPDQS